MTTKEVAIVENNVMNPSMVPSAWYRAASASVVAAPIALRLEGEVRVRTAVLAGHVAPAAQRDGAIAGATGFGKRGFAATPGPSAWSPPV